MEDAGGGAGGRAELWRWAHGVEEPTHRARARRPRAARMDLAEGGWDPPRRGARRKGQQRWWWRYEREGLGEGVRPRERERELREIFLE
jgi:hypothetical protein